MHTGPQRGSVATRASTDRALERIVSYRCENSHCVAAVRISGVSSQPARGCDQWLLFKRQLAQEAHRSAYVGMVDVESLTRSAV